MPEKNDTDGQGAKGAEVVEVPAVPKINGAPAEPAMLMRSDQAVGFASASSFALLQRAATLLAASTLVPETFRGNLPNCVIALNMAQRIGADPLMVMQNLYVVHGRPGWSAQFLIATFNQNGRFSALRYEFFGDKGTPTRGCRAYTIEKATGERLTGSDITMQLAADEGWSTKAGSKWKTMPEQMLMYRAAAWLIRAYAPEIAMGLHTTEELHDVVEMEPTKSGVFEAKGEAPKEGEGGKLDQLADKLASGGAQ